MSDRADQALTRLQAMAMARGALALLEHLDVASDAGSRSHLENAVVLLESAVLRDRDAEPVHH